MNQISYFVGIVLVWLAGMSGSLGNAIVLFSLLLKTLLLPLSVASQKQMDKMKKMQPHLKNLKAKHKDDPKAFQQAQIDLMKEHQVNPVGGCIPQLVQFGILIALYQVFISVFKSGEINGQVFDTTYLWFDLSKPDTTFILPILTGVLQFVLSLMMLAPTVDPTEELVPLEDVGKKKKKQKKNMASAIATPPPKDDMADFSATMQKQMVFMLPVMTTLSFVFLKLPSGLALYWTVTSMFSIVQQYYLSGPGALEEYWLKAKTFVQAKTK